MQMTSKNPQPQYIDPSYLIQDLLLELPLNLLSRLICVGFAVEVKKSTKIELRCLQELNFADVDLDSVSYLLIAPSYIVQRTFCNG